MNTHGSLSNTQVVERWVANKRGHGHNMSTNGIHLWSYAMCIGSTTPDGRKILVVAGVTQTTKRHYTLARRRANMSINDNTHAWHSEHCEHIETIRSAQVPTAYLLA